MDVFWSQGADLGSSQASVEHQNEHRPVSERTIISPDAKELAELYTPTSAEISFASSKARNDNGKLSFLVMLKTFQRLGYFPHPEHIPNSVLNHIRSCLKLKPKVNAIPPERSRRRYEETIRAYLGVSPYNKQAQRVAAQAIATMAEIQDHPADLVNVAIEELVKERYELPAFSTLDRLVSKVRTAVNNRLFEKVASQMSPVEIAYLDGLLGDEPPLMSSEGYAATLSDLKAIPKNATISHIRELQTKFDRLMSFGDAQSLVKNITPTKVKYFAALAKAMDISELRAVKLPKRRTLLLCLLYTAQTKAKDHLVEMFLKRMAKIHRRGKDKLVELREKHRAITELLLGVLGEILSVTEEQSNQTALGEQIQSVIETYGGVEFLRSECEAVAAYNSDNYFPLLWQFYRSHRSTLFRLVDSLEIRSTTQDQSLIEAVKFLLENQHRRGEWLPKSIQLDFAGELWQRQVLFRKGNGTEVLLRRQLEVCVFSCLATELKSGDACVLGSGNFADYREQLLSWSECQQELASYCTELGFPEDAVGFVHKLQAELTQAAVLADQICSEGDQVTISASGEPVLKRLTALTKPPGAEKLEAAIRRLLPERSLLEILCNVEHWLNWTRHFGPLSGLEGKLVEAQERYLLTIQGHLVNREMISTLSPYITGHIKRYGDYVVDLSQIPQPLETAIELPVD